MSPSKETVASNMKSAEDTRQLSEFGIVNRPVDQYHCGGYRYSNLEDAIAQGKRIKNAEAANETQS